MDCDETFNYVATWLQIGLLNSGEPAVQKTKQAVSTGHLCQLIG